MEQFYYFLGWLNGRGYAVVDRDLINRRYLAPDADELTDGFVLPDHFDDDPFDQGVRDGEAASDE